MKILFATPAFGGVITTKYLESFLRTMAAVSELGHQMTIVTVERDGLVSMARNGCANAALDNGFDKILFVDADIIWQPDQVVELLKSKKQIVGGTYPYKGYPLKLVFNAHPDHAPALGQKTLKEFTTFCAQHRHQNPDWDGELEVKQIPTGFLLIDVSVLKELAPKRPKYIRQGAPGSKNKEEIDFFRIGLMTQPSGRVVYETEDFGFCNVAQENGFKVYLNTKVIVGHLGFHEFNVWKNGGGSDD